MRSLRHRPDRCAQQAPRRRHGASFLLRDHPLRQGSRGLPGTSRPPGADPLEHPGPRRRGHRSLSRLPRLPCSGRRPAHPHRIPHPSHRTAGTRGEGAPAMTGLNDSTVNVRYLVDDVQAALDFYTTTSALPCGPRTCRRSPTSPAATCGCCSPGRPVPRDVRCRTAGAGPGRLEPHPPHRGRPARRDRPAARRRGHLPQRHRHRAGRPAGPSRGPRRQSDRTVRPRSIEVK